MSERWPVRKIGDVISLEYGRPLPKDQRCEEAGFPAYGANGIKCYAIKPFWQKRSIIVGRKGTAGAVNLVEGGFWPLDVTYYVTFNECENDLKFIYYMLSSLDLPSLATGVKPGINRNVVYAIEQPFPPLPEQKRIVAILDETFAGIDTAIANTEKNLANARELFNSYLNSVFSQQGEGWTVETLDQICVIARGGSPRPIKAYLTDESGGVNWIKISDATASSKFVYETKQKIRPEGVKKSRMVHAGDLLLSNSMSFGRPYIMRTSGCIHDGWLVLSNKVDAYETNYLYYFLGSPEAYSQFDLRASGSTVRNLNIDLVRSVKVPIPPLPEQARIAANIEELEIEAQRLEAIYQQKLTALTELKQSLLQKAFSGELTADSAEAVDRVEAALA